MPETPRRGMPRASRIMVDVFHAIGSCSGLVHYWDVGKRPEGGVLLRAASERRYATEEAAVEAARALAERLQPPGYEVQAVSPVARADGAADAGWQAFVEMLIA